VASMRPAVVRLAAGLCLAGLCLGAGLVAVSARAAGPRQAHTAAGDAAASRSLLSSGDLGSGWTATTKPGRVGFGVDCAGYQPSERGIVVTGSASSPDFAGGELGPYILQLTNVYASAAQAAAVWRRAIMQSGLVSCVAQTLDGVTAQGISVKILAEGRLPVQKVGSMTTGYRVVADLSSARTKTTHKTYFDVVLVARGSTISEITISTFGSPVPPKVEYALAYLVYHQIGLPTA
jgi:hypothetical protein